MMNVIEVTRRWLAGQSAQAAPQPPDALEVAKQKRALEVELRKAGWSRIQAVAEASRLFAANANSGNK